MADFLSPTPAIPAHQPIPTYVERPSADGRRVYTETLAVNPSSPIKRMYTRQAVVEPLAPMEIDEPDDTSTGFDPLLLADDRYDMQLGGFYDRPASPPLPPPRNPKPVKPSVGFFFQGETFHLIYIGRINLCMNGGTSATNI
jgi:hypothetical protein